MSVKVCVSVDCSSPSPTGNGNGHEPSPNPLSWFSGLVGDGSASSFTVAHDLDSLDIVVSVREISTGIITSVPTTVLDYNRIRLDFSAVPAVDSYIVLVIAVK